MLKKLTVAAATFGFLFQAQAADTNEFDTQRFQQMRQQVLQNKKVLQSAPKVQIQGQSQTPFQAQVQKIQREQGVTAEQAKQQLEKQMGASIVSQKDKYRSGGYKNLGFNPTREVEGTEQQLSQMQDVGRRASDGQVQWFMPGSFEKSLRDLKKQASIEGQQQPWSDDYWALANGVLGHRYAGETEGYEWDDRLKYVLTPKGHISNVLNITNKEEREAAIDKLSPSEKYDLLIGNIDPDTAYWDWVAMSHPIEYQRGMGLYGKVGGFLTPDQWQQGQYYFDSSGSVESWMGICHGWATAAIQLPRPKKIVKVKAKNGDTIKFYPAEIKALGSYLWAQSAPRSRFIGGRCNDKDAQTDSASGALVAKNCFDTNPADWHLVVANYLGEMKQSFVMDMTFDYEVWNQPVLSYSYNYFNPYDESGSISSLQEAAVPYDQTFKNQDMFKNVRRVKSGTKYIVGVYMTVRYLSENSPQQRSSDGPQYDHVTETYYTYDLELNANYEPIGGEWHFNEHPDFLWVHDKGQEAYSNREANEGHTYDSLKNYISLADGETHPTVLDWAVQSAKQGQVNGSIVRALFEAAK